MITRDRLTSSFLSYIYLRYKQLKTGKYRHNTTNKIANREFLDGRSPYVTASMDRGLNLPYGTALCIPELNRHYRRRINIEVRDTHADLDGFGTSKVVICVRSVADSYDLAVNRPVSLIIEK